MKKNYDAFTRFCMAMGDDNGNCPICPLQGTCDARPHKYEYDVITDFEDAESAWREAANTRAEQAAQVFGVEI